MLRTIWVWTQEWSDMPSRSAWTCAMYHQARTCSSPLTASRNCSSLRLPRVGARTCASAIASAGGLRFGPSGSGVGTPRLSRHRHRASPSYDKAPGEDAGPCPRPAHARSAADRPGTGAATGRRAAPPGSPARPRKLLRGRRSRLPIPRCRSRTGTCRGSCRRRRRRSGRRPTRRSRSRRASPARRRRGGWRTLPGVRGAGGRGGPLGCGGRDADLAVEPRGRPAQQRGARRHGLASARPIRASALREVPPGGGQSHSREGDRAVRRTRD